MHETERGNIENNLESAEKSDAETLESLASETREEIFSLADSLVEQAEEVLTRLPEIKDCPEFPVLSKINQEIRAVKEEANDSIAWIKERFDLDKSEKENFGSLEIKGSREFREKVKNSLRFLSLASEKLGFVEQNIKRIQEWSHSGMNVFKDKPTFEIGDMWKDHDEIYMASAIAHDAYHSHLCKNSEDAHGNISISAFNGKDAERKCLAFQIETLEEIRDSDYLREHSESIDGINKHIDGLRELMINPTYQDIPYEERNW